MTHQDQNAAIAARAARRPTVYDPENVGKIKRRCDATALAESEIRAALKKAGCGIIKGYVAPPPPPPKPGEPDRDWLMLASDAYRPPALKQLVRIVSARTGVGLYEMQSNSRMPRIVRARMIYCAIARKLTRWGTPEIGKKVGRDHSTVMHAIAKVDAKTSYFEPEFSEILKAFGHLDEADKC